MRLTELEQRVCAEIASREDDLLHDLRLHVETPTGGHNTAALDETRERLCARLESLGATRTLIPGEPRPEWLYRADPSVPSPPTAVCDRRRDAGNRVLIAGHLDTVHPPESSFRELSIEPGGKRATGPGCVDMKGGLVIATAALEALESAGASASWSFLLNSDEETGSFCSEAAIRTTCAGHDFGLAIEPALAGGELAVERMGSGQFMIEARGRSAHVGRAFADGVSAVTALAECLVRVSEIAAPDEGRIVSVGPIEGGEATNAVPDRARAWGNARFPSAEVAEQILDRLREIETEDGALPGLQLFSCFARPAKPRTAGVEALAGLAVRVAGSLDQRLPLAATGGVCDGNIMQDAGLPTIDTLGVRGGGLHTTDEWIDLSSLVERCQLFAVLVHRLTTEGT